MIFFSQQAGQVAISFSSLQINVGGILVDVQQVWVWLFHMDDGLYNIEFEFQIEGGTVSQIFRIHESTAAFIQRNTNETISNQGLSINQND